MKTICGGYYQKWTLVVPGKLLIWPMALLYFENLTISAEIWSNFAVWAIFIFVTLTKVVFAVKNECNHVHTLDQPKQVTEIHFNTSEKKKNKLDI